VRVILDECIDRRLVSSITGHEVRTVPQVGWAAIENGRLLALAAKEFDVFVTGRGENGVRHHFSLRRFHGRLGR